MMRYLLAPLFLAVVVSARSASQSVECNDFYCYCVSKDGQNIGYNTPASADVEKNCKCASEQYEYQQTGMVGKTFSCDEHGNYKSVQCVGSVCHCSTSTGEKIGYETPIHMISEKNCECALDKYAYQQTGMVGKTFSCDEHGNYSPVQCVGSVCHCSTSTGDKIGYETPIHQASEKNCQCALDKHEYQQTGMVGKTFSCDELGNYNAVQCLGSVCHCAASTGDKIGYETPIHQASEKTCECAVDKYEYEQKGLIGKTFSCDEHGNYNAVNCIGSMCHCMTPEGKNIGYVTPIHQVSEKNCQCALDKHEYKQTGMVGKTFSCDEHGNYNAVQCVGSVCHCANSTGHKIGYETPIHQVSEKTCQCALDEHEYKQTGLLGQTFSCDEHGNYNPVNCVGSVCHCMSPDGQHIGYETPIHSNHMKTCQCALDKHEYEQQGLLGQTFSCDEYGNYNSVRCVGSVCYCVDIFGKQVGSSVPIGQHDSLNC